MSINNKVIAIVGLGYVGLPLAIEFGKSYQTIGFDVAKTKIKNFNDNIDLSGQIDKQEFQNAKYLAFTNEEDNLAKADFIIVAVPTPIKEAHTPDLTPLISATISVAKYMKKGCVVVFESTVFPSATEEVCIPLLEKWSKLKWKTDFNVGYSPERVNPGDAHRKITDIVKVVSGDCKSTLKTLSGLYGAIIKAGIYEAQSIKVAEAAKVIENTQRDLNIALMNELAIIFDKLDIDTLEVLKAAETKWNFLPFRPGLVGGHCIGVDPYYLTHKAEMVGYHPEVILAGRRINDAMPEYIARQTIKKMINKGAIVKGSKINILGLTFKENCPDIRNSKVAKLVTEFEEYGCEVVVCDPWVSLADAKTEYSIDILPWESLSKADGLVVAVAHQCFLDLELDELLTKLHPSGVFVDVKSMFSELEISNAGYEVWRL